MRFCSAPNCDAPVFGSCKISRKGYCKTHQFLREDFDKRSIMQKAVSKRQNGINNKVRSLNNPSLEDKAINQISKNKEQWDWFLERRKEMTGKCANCGGITTKSDDSKFHFSIAHLLPKNYFPSISKHPDNWLELCFYGNSCHTNFDNHMIDIIDLHCFDSAIQKFAKMYPSISKEERRRIPSILLQYLETEI